MRDQSSRNLLGSAEKPAKRTVIMGEGGIGIPWRCEELPSPGIVRLPGRGSMQDLAALRAVRAWMGLHKGLGGDTAMPGRFVSHALALLMLLLGELCLGMLVVAKPTLPFLLVGVVGAVMLAMANPAYNYFLGLLALPSNPLGLPVGSGPILGALDPMHLFIATGLIGWLLRGMASRRAPSLGRDGITLPLTIFVGWLVLSSLWGSLSGPLALLTLIKLLFDFAVYMFSLFVVRTRRSLEMAVSIWILTGIMLASLALVIPFNAPELSRAGDVAGGTGDVSRIGTTFNPVVFSALLMFYTLLCLAKLRATATFSMKVALALAVMLMLAADTRTGSLAGFCSLAVGVAFFVWLCRRDRWRGKRIPIPLHWVAVGFIVLLMVIVTPYIIVREFEYNVLYFWKNPSFVYRYLRWQDGFEMLKNSDTGSYIYGLGFGTYAFLNDLKYGGKRSDAAIHAHNVYLHIFFEQGIIGLSIFFWLIMSFIKSFGTAIKTSAGTPYEKLLYGFSSGLVALGVHDLFDTQLYQTYPWAFLGLGVAVIRLARQEAQSSLKDEKEQE